ncbi:MAG: hypothetical protein IJ416_01745 [Ruminiclostridium sp.]|nr:hypothetical protein [Ruminiclostridium sp.]MBQ8825887.1 hypothetical protein [Oscillospiraceae bacterium]
MEYKYDRSRHFEIPKYFYFEVMNSTVGGRNTFNYRIDPVKREKEDGETELLLVIKIWIGMVCSELAEFEAENEFEHTFEGYKAMIYWLDNEYDVYKGKIESGELQSRRTFKGEL